MKNFKTLIIIVCLFLLAGCTVDPVTGKSSFNIYSEKDEIAIGEREHPKIVAQYGEYNDPQLKRYIQNIVNKLGDVCHRPNLNYKTTVLDTPMINAFALPGGNVYICRGLLAYLNSEAELAAIMGHEIGHVNARHSVERLSSMQGMQIGLLVGSLFFKKKAEAKSFYNVGSGLSILSSFSYSRENEMEADRLGLQYANKAGFSPLGLGATMKMFERMNSNKSGNALYSILSTHPVSSIRSKQARIEVRKLEQQGTINKDINREQYLQKINNIVLGYDPRKGIVQQNKFYNTTIYIKFNLPTGYKVYQEVPGAVLALENEEQTKQIYFNIHYNQNNIVKTQQEFAENIKTNPIKKIDRPLLGAIGKASIYLQKTADNRYIQITHYVLSYQNNILEFTTYEKKEHQGYDYNMLTLFTSNIKPMTTKEKSQIKVKKLQLYKTKPGDTWQNVAIKQLHISDAEKLSWFNGAEPDEPILKTVKLKMF